MLSKIKEKIKNLFNRFFKKPKEIEGKTEENLIDLAKDRTELQTHPYRTSQINTENTIPIKDEIEIKIEKMEESAKRGNYKEFVEMNNEVYLEIIRRNSNRHIYLNALSTILNELKKLKDMSLKIVFASLIVSYLHLFFVNELNTKKLKTRRRKAKK